MTCLHSYHIASVHACKFCNRMCVGKPHAMIVMHDLPALTVFTFALSQTLNNFNCMCSWTARRRAKVRYQPVQHAFLNPQMPVCVLIANIHRTADATLRDPSARPPPRGIPPPPPGRPAPTIPPSAGLRWDDGTANLPSAPNGGAAADAAADQFVMIDPPRRKPPSVPVTSAEHSMRSDALAPKAHAAQAPNGVAVSAMAYRNTVPNIAVAAKPVSGTDKSHAVRRSADSCSVNWLLKYCLLISHSHNPSNSNLHLRYRQLRHRWVPRVHTLDWMPR